MINSICLRTNKHSINYEITEVSTSSTTSNTTITCQLAKGGHLSNAVTKGKGHCTSPTWRAGSLETLNLSSSASTSSRPFQSKQLRPHTPHPIESCSLKTINFVSPKSSTASSGMGYLAPWNDGTRRLHKLPNKSSRHVPKGLTHFILRSNFFHF